MSARRSLVLAVLCACLSSLLVVTGHSASSAAEVNAVRAQRVIGHSVQGRPIIAYRLGERHRNAPTVVLLATIHGDEPAPRQILLSLRDGRPFLNVNLWVVPTYNPDGLARGTRQNARGVDLNRNFPYLWADLDGKYESGPKPASEPETKAVMKFLRRVDPVRVINFHQPLHGVDTDAKSVKFERRVADKLNLPRKTFNCGGICRGTLPGWFNNRFDGTALTVEYGPKPSLRHLRTKVPGQVLSIFRAKYGVRARFQRSP